MEDTLFIAVDNLKKLITCSICLDFYSEPVSLLCTHTYCKLCIEPVICSKKSCPICSASIKRKYIKDESDKVQAIEEVSKFVNQYEQQFRRPTGTTTSTSTVNTSKESAHAPYLHPSTSIVGAFSNSTHMEGTAIPSGELPSSSVEEGRPQLLADRGSTALGSSETTDIHESMYRIGDLVEVAPRTWAGINKLGGIARIFSIANDTHTEEAPAEQAYSVKYVLDGSVELGLSAALLSPYTELQRSTRRARTSEDGGNSLPRTPRGKYSIEQRNTESGGDSAQRKRKIHYSDADTPGQENIPDNAYWSDLPHTATSSSSKKPTPTTSSIARNDNEIINPKGRRLVLLSSALDPFLQSKLSLLAERCAGVSVTNALSEEVTHLVVEANKQRVTKHRTMKYLQTLISGRWIVSAKWISQCLKQQRLLDEADFEVTDNTKATIPEAPRRARLALTQNSSKAGDCRTVVLLFSGLAVYFAGQFPQPGPSKADLAYLLGRGGATLCSSLQELQDSANQPVVVCSSKVYEYEFQVAWAAATGPGAQREVQLVSTAWVLDCVVNFSLLPLTNSYM